jgi:UDP-galactopyranose mutase
VATATPIVCFSHLRWHSVFQRPHHLLSRLARRHPVLFFEEPILIEGQAPFLTVEDVAPGIRVYRPHLESRWPFFSGDASEVLTTLVAEMLEREGAHEAIFWFYTPMALHAARPFRSVATVYDCMDELSRFKDAPAELLDLEAELLGRADLVFTGGPSLYEAKRHRHPRAHCFPSSVDAAHFERAAVLACPVHPATAALPSPRLGFYGVIDERIDLPLLDALAATRPDWQIVMVGPVTKIDPGSLPRRPNLHYPGPAAYADLPAHLAGWDVALMPFARNEATEFISPTKTLEYMAAGLPIVSTSITDVARPYGHIVAIADTAADFARACERALEEAPAARQERRAGYAAVLRETSWDRTAAAMRALLDPHLVTGAVTSASPIPLAMASHPVAS